MKRISMILATMALVLGLSQCKKQEPTSNIVEGMVTITLDVGANKSSRINVNPDSGDVAFEQNDVVYVASGGKFVGTLTCRGTSFKGQITNPTLNQPLYFFFLGNMTPDEALTAGTSTTCSVNIGDQSSGKLPVISFATSDQDFTGEGTYTAFFLNKAALVKFDVTTSSDAATCINGMNNKVTVSFADNSFDYSKEGDGIITLPAGSGEKWAILLPQAQLTGVEAFSSDRMYSGICGTVPTIGVNGYLFDGIAVNVSTAKYVDLGLPSGLLWATCNLGADNPEDYGDYFAWGETTTKSTYNWSTYQYCNGNNNTLTKYCNNSSYGYNGFTDNLTTLLPEDDAATANWGNGWRMPTMEEFQELYNNTTMTWTTQNGVNGRLFTASNGNSLFLPAAGYRGSSSLYDAGSYGYYWSRSLRSGDPGYAWRLYFNSDNCRMSGDSRYYGQSVRPVRVGSQN